LPPVGIAAGVNTAGTQALRGDIMALVVHAAPQSGVYQAVNRCNSFAIQLAEAENNDTLQVGPKIE
jgi:hypothetical protein